MLSTTATVVSSHHARRAYMPEEGKSTAVVKEENGKRGSCDWTKLTFCGSVSNDISSRGKV